MNWEIVSLMIALLKAVFVDFPSTHNFFGKDPFNPIISQFVFHARLSAFQSGERLSLTSSFSKSNDIRSLESR